LESTKRLLTELGRWDESRVVTRFKRGFKFEEVRVIRSGGVDIGWLQTSNSADGLHLDQLHIVHRFRNRGIGTQLIQTLQKRARSAGKPVGLNVIRGNQAIVLYRRLGFRIVGEDDEKLKMRWDAEGSKRSRP
jgi:ribosomal protein S18 acetylase RimI-like enzyme